MITICELKPENAAPYVEYLGLGPDISPLFESELYHPFLLGICNDGCPAGALRGVIPIERPGFFSLDRFFLDPQVDAAHALSCLVNELRIRLDRHGVRRLAMRYRYEASSQSDRDQTYTLLCSYFTDWYAVKKKEISCLRLGLTSEIPRLRKHRWFETERIPKEFQVIPWGQYPAEDKERLRRNEQRFLEEQADYLGPFFPEPCDERTSLVVVDSTTGDAVGWGITGEFDSRTILLRRFFVRRRYRNLLIGPALGTHVLELMRRYYPRFGFKVISGNRSMQLISTHYFDEIMPWRIVERQFDMERSSLLAS